MRTILIPIALFLALISCTKENSDENVKEPEVQISEFEALKQEVEELKAHLATFTPNEQTASVSLEEFNALKEENETLRVQVANLMSTFFEVDGLRFDKNGDVISVPKIESTYQKQTNTGTLTMTRTFDDKGRLIETYGKYSGYNSSQNPPYYWQKITHEYNGKTRSTKTETSSYSYGIYTHEDNSETTYW